MSRRWGRWMRLASSQHPFRFGVARADGFRSISVRCVIIVALLASASPVAASHLRYSHVNWSPRVDVDPNAIDFTVEAVWRRTAFRTGNDRCIDAATLSDTACTGAGDFAGVGDIIHERQGDTRFDPGDASGLIGGPGALSNALLFLVTSVDVDNNWLFTVAVDPGSLPAASPPYDTAITHVYPNAGDFTATMADCCRIGECHEPNAHMNNPDSNYRVETRVNVGTGNSSPVTGLPPIVLCPVDGLCQFTVPVSDDDLDPVTFRLSTSAESGIDSHPGAPQCPNSASIDSLTGIYTWDTTGCAVAGDPFPEPPDGGCNDASLNTLYSTQVMIEEAPGGSRVAVDFLIQLVSSCVLGNETPTFDPPTPTCGSSLAVNPDGLLTFDVSSSDPDAADTVQLNAIGLPSGATMSPGLPTSGQPAQSSFSWVPSAAQQGQHVVTFTAVDGCGEQATCVITIDVSDENCTDGVDNDGDGLADCADPDCAATPCDDGLFCTSGDTCLAGVCSGGPVSCDDGNDCTIDSCDEGSTSCVNDSAAANGNACDDGEFCTDGDSCSAGSCTAGGARDCSSFDNGCNLGVCNESIDQCEPLPANDGSLCDDLLFCTTGEFCTSGVCAGGAALSCGDGNSCTIDSCDEGADQCVNQVVAGCCGNSIVESGEECDDGNLIGGDGCEPDCSRSTGCSFTYGVGAELFVGGCGSPNYGTVQSAVDAAQDGDTVSICPGVYNESVVVNAEITLRSSAGAAVTEVRANGTAIDIRRSGVSVEDLTVVSDTGSAIEANTICPLAQSTCGSSAGSNLRITGNVLRDSVAGVHWTSRVDCVEISSNQLIDNVAPISLLQAVGPPAIFVEVGGESGGLGVGNTVQGGGSIGAAVEVAGIGVSVVANQIEASVADGLLVRDSGGDAVTIAANTITGSAAAGVVLSNVGVGSTLVENDIDSNVGDGIRIESGAVDARVENNNIENNGVGLANEAGAGVLDATLNWWNSQTGPSGVFAGVGDSIENRSGATTDFVEFLCRRFPEGFASVDGICSVETAELRQLVPGRRPDVDPFGRFIVFESSKELDVDGRSSLENPDLSQEIFLLDRHPRPKLGGICLGGLLPCDFDDVQSCTTCTGNHECPGDPNADPIVLNGECVQITQLTDDPTGAALSSAPRITGRGKEVFCATTADQMGTNADGSSEVLAWNRRQHEKGNVAGAHTMLTDAPSGIDYGAVAPSLTGRFIAVESNADPVGDNPDGNIEIFVYSPRKDVWFQVTRTTGFCTVSGGECATVDDCEGPGDTCQVVDNRHPSTVDGKRISFESTGDLHSNPKVQGVNNPDHNREIFVAKLKKSGTPVITQVTDSQAPVANMSPSSDTRAKLVAFSSDGDFSGNNVDGSREIFVWTAKTNTFEQVTDAPTGDSDNPVIGASGRWLVFESTSDLNLNGATNRRVFQFDRELGEFLTLSRLRFGVNQLPRIRRRRFVTWESTANLTGGNPSGDWAVFVFDRKKNDD